MLNRPHNYSILLCPFSFVIHNTPIRSDNNQISRTDISGIIWVNGVFSTNFSGRKIRAMLRVSHPHCWKCNIHVEDTDRTCIGSQTVRHPG